MSVPDPDAFESPPRCQLKRSTLSVRSRLYGNAAIDVYAAAGCVRDTERTVRLAEPRLQGTQRADGIDRFERRVSQWAAVDDHPLVASVIDWGVYAGVPWVVSEHGTGPVLAERIAADVVDPTESVWLARTLCGVVEHARTAMSSPVGVRPVRILSRDAGPDEWNLPRVTELGVGPLLDDVVECDGGLSTEYAAPERFHPAALGPTDERTDVYSIGAVLYELLTGVVPFPDGPAAPTGVDAPARPTERNPDLPGVTDDVVLQALAVSPADRYRTLAYLDRGLAEVMNTLSA